MRTSQVINAEFPFNSSTLLIEVLPSEEEISLCHDPQANGLHRCHLTWTGVVVDFIGRDSNLGGLSFSLHNSQLLLGGVGMGQTTRTRLRLELEQDRKQSAWTPFTPNINIQERHFNSDTLFLNLNTYLIFITNIII